MKTIGLIGGTSYHSTIEYYRLFNEEVNARLGGFHSAKMLMKSLDFQEMVTFMDRNDWSTFAKELRNDANMLQDMGAEGILLCSTTIHKAAEFDDIPGLLHIGDMVGTAIKSAKMSKVALLGTLVTMSDGFMQNKITNVSSAEVIAPNEAEQRFIHDAILNEMCKGQFLPQTRERFLEIIDGLKERGAEGVILGCTEIPLLIQEASLPLFDTMQLHVRGAVDYMLQTRTE
jgi:aspartate racemase